MADYIKNIRDVMEHEGVVFSYIADTLLRYYISDVNLTNERSEYFKIDVTTVYQKFVKILIDTLLHDRPLVNEIKDAFDDIDKYEQYDWHAIYNSNIANIPKNYLHSKGIYRDIEDILHICNITVCYFMIIVEFVILSASGKIDIVDGCSSCIVNDFDNDDGAQSMLDIHMLAMIYNTKPVLSSFINKIAEECSVHLKPYFVNKANSVPIKWETMGTSLNVYIVASKQIDYDIRYTYC